MALTDIATSKFPNTLDDDSSIPHLLPGISDVSATDYLQLKSAVIALEKTLGVFGITTDDPSFQSLKELFDEFSTTYFVPVTGGVSISGNIDMAIDTQITFNKTESSCSGFITYSTSGVPSGLVDPTARIALFTNDNPLTTQLVSPLSIVGNDASPDDETAMNRRVKIFDDLDVAEDLRIGRDLIFDDHDALVALPENVTIGGIDLDDRYVNKAKVEGDYMLGSLTQGTGGSFIVSNAEGAVNLTTPSLTVSPTLIFENNTQTWNMDANNNVLEIYALADSEDYNVKQVNIFDSSGVSETAPQGYRHLVKLQVIGDVQTETLTVAATTAPVATYPRPFTIQGDAHGFGAWFAGDTVSPNHYELGSGHYSVGFDGSLDLVGEHILNVNAHHEELHSFESHLVEVGKGTGSYRTFTFPTGSESLGQMLENLVSGGNADVYHVHGNLRYWGTMPRTVDDSTTIMQWAYSTFCAKADGCGGSDGYWGSMRRSSSDSTYVDAFVERAAIGDEYDPVPTRFEDVTDVVVGTYGTIGVDTDGYNGYRPFWSLLEKASDDETSLIDYIASVAGTGGGGTSYWNSMAKSSSDSTTIEQFLTGKTGGVVGKISNTTTYGYTPYWDGLPKSQTDASTLSVYFDNLLLEHLSETDPDKQHDGSYIKFEQPLETFAYNPNYRPLSSINVQSAIIEVNSNLNTHQFGSSPHSSQQISFDYVSAGFDTAEASSNVYLALQEVRNSHLVMIYNVEFSSLSATVSSGANVEKVQDYKYLSEILNLMLADYGIIGSYSVTDFKWFVYGGVSYWRGLYSMQGFTADPIIYNPNTTTAKLSLKYKCEGPSGAQLDMKWKGTVIAVKKT